MQSSKRGREEQEHVAVPSRRVRVAVGARAIEAGDLYCIAPRRRRAHRTVDLKRREASFGSRLKTVTKPLEAKQLLLPEMHW